MVGAVHQKPRPAGDGTELPNHQPVAVDGVVVQHVVLLKVPGIAGKIVVDCKIANFNSWILDGVFQIDGLAVPCPGVQLRGSRNRHGIFSFFI